MSLGAGGAVATHPVEPNGSWARPDRFAGTPLLAAERWMDRVAVIGADHAWTWRQIHFAAANFARSLSGAAAVCNLCKSRVAFLVTWLAALRCNLRMVLPPSGVNADLADIITGTPGTVVVIDDDDDIQAPWRQCLKCEPERVATSTTPFAPTWRANWDCAAVVFHTSGSTGKPRPHTRTLLQLATGALVMGDALSKELADAAATLERIVCSVSPQHMFGFETSVMLPLVHAIAVFEGRPLLPADVLRAFERAPATAWIATPLHLRGLVGAAGALPNCRVVIASTMPLAQKLAHDAEALVQAPVLEIYGSTETGILAVRRTERESEWRPACGVRVDPVDGGALAHGLHFSSPVRLADQIELIDTAGRFRLVGRQADLIKIAGRRASLAGLNLTLQDLPGLEDGTFYLPSQNEPTDRLCLIYSGAPIDRAVLERWLRSRLDPAFKPRTLIRVHRLPRGENGKLPRQALDRIYAQWRGESGRPDA